MRRTLFVFVLLLAAMAVQGCSKPKNIYPDNPWRTSEAGIEVIAVAPFLVKPEIATVMNQSFECFTFKTSDGFDVHFSEQFAQEFANGLKEFNGMSIVNPERVMRAWVDAVQNGEMTNPLATRSDALKIASRLKADAIIVGELVEWNPFDGRMTLDWSIHSTHKSTVRAIDVRTLENSGKGGLLSSNGDRANGALFAQQIALDREGRKTRELLEIYATSLSMEDSQGYPNPANGVVARPFPRLVRFASWVAMTSAFKGTTVEENGGSSKSESTASGE